MIYGVPTLNTLEFAILRRLDVVIPACLKLSTVDPKPQIRKPLCPITQDMARLLLIKYFQPYAVQNAGASVFAADLRRMLNKRAGKTTSGSNQSPSPQTANHPKHLRTRHLATAEQRRYIPRRFHGRPTAGLPPRSAGHTPLFNQLDMTVDPKCPRCREELQTVEHWL